MFNNSTKDELRGRLRDYVQLVTRPDPKKRKDFFICPICNSGASGRRDSDGDFHITGDEWFCHSCQEGGDIFRLYGRIHDLNEKTDFPKIVEGLSGELGVTSYDAARKDFKPMKTENLTRRQAIESFAAQMPGSRADADLHSRGFVNDTIKHFNLGYNPSRWVKDKGTFESIVIPYPGEDYYTERLIEPGIADKYQNQTGTTPIFLIHEKTDSDFYLITEGQLDALSLWQAGARNVIACHYPNRLRDYIDNGLRIESAVIVADRDPEEKRDEKTGLTPGEKQAQKIAQVLDDFKIRNVTVFPPEGFKDSNDVLSSSQEMLSSLFPAWSKKLQEKKEEQQEENSFLASPINVKDFILGGGYDKGIEYFKKYKDRKTGFENLDRYLTLYPGVACLGGASSLGKTTFAVNLCDNLLERGESIIYFSLEQLPIEIVTKSLARRLYAADPMTVLTNTDIKEGASSDALEDVKKEYAKIADRYQIIEANFYYTAEDILNYVKNYIETTKIKPIVVIDYLQLIAPPKGFNGTQREITDENLKSIKYMSKQFGLFVLLISSFNRASYIEPVSYESFKESGMIEFTCDYIFGLQLSILEDSKFYSQKSSRGAEKEKNLDKKRKAIYKAQRQLEKEVELVSLKNRNGKQSFKCFFKYRMDYDSFTPDLNSSHDPERIITGAIRHEDGSETVAKSKRETERETLQNAYDCVKLIYGTVTLQSLAEQLDISTTAVKRRMKEYGGYSIDGGKELETAGANTIIDMPEFHSVADTDIPFESV